MDIGHALQIRLRDWKCVFLKTELDTKILFSSIYITFPWWVSDPSPVNYNLITGSHPGHWQTLSSWFMSSCVTCVTTYTHGPPPNIEVVTISCLKVAQFLHFQFSRMMCPSVCPVCDWEPRPRLTPSPHSSHWPPTPCDYGRGGENIWFRTMQLWCSGAERANTSGCSFSFLIFVIRVRPVSPRPVFWFKE